jgi:tetratricopeptide (TPR) repeat protein
MSIAAKHRKKAAEFEQLKKFDLAIASYIRAIEESEAAGDDVDVALFNKVGDLTLRQGRVPDAVTYYERAVDHYASAGLFNNAIALCNKVLRHAPGRAAVYLSLGRICARKGLRGDATRNFLEYASRMRLEGRLEEAMHTLAEVAHQHPDLADVRAFVEEHAARSGIELRRRDTPAGAQPNLARHGPERDDAANELVFLDVGFDAFGRPLTPRRALTPASVTPPSVGPVRAPGATPRVVTAVGAAGGTAGEPSRDEPATAPRFEDFLIFQPEPDPPAPEGHQTAYTASEPPSGGIGDGVPPIGATDDLAPKDPSGDVPWDGAEPADVDAPSAHVHHVTAPHHEVSEVEVFGDFSVPADAVADPVEGFAPDDDASTYAEVPVGTLRTHPAPIEAASIPLPADLESHLVVVERSEHDDVPLLDGLTTDGMDSDGLPATDPPGAEPAIDEPRTDEPRTHEAASAALAAGAVWRPDPHDFILPGELPPLQLSNERVRSGVERARRAAAEAAAEAAVEAAEAAGTAAESTDDVLVGAAPASEPAASDEAPVTPTLVVPGDAIDEEPVEVVPDASDASHEAFNRRDALRAAVAEAPQDWALRRRLAEVLFETGAPEEGFVELETALNGYQRSGMAHVAAEVADELVRLRPEHIPYHQRRVELAVRLGAQERLRDAYLDLADVLVRAGDDARARAVYARVLELDPWDDRARLALGDAAPPPPTREEPRRADGQFVSLQDWLQDDAPVSTRMRMQEPAASGDEDADFDALLRHFKEGVARSVGEEDYESHYDLGVAYKEMGLLDDAIAEFQKALRGRTRRLPAYEALGQCFVEQQRYQVAATVLSRALHEPGLDDEQRIGVLYLLGFSCEALRRWDQARGYYQRVFATDIQFRDVAARLAALDQVAS